MKLKSVTLQSFRGATHKVTVPFNEAKKITMIFGENGTGKSTIVDAFSFLCEQSTGSLKDRSSADDSFISSITDQPTATLVQISTDQQTWEAKLRGKSITVSPNSSVPQVRILRRKQILRLIDTPPNERYKELGSYIDISNIAKCEDSLRKAEKEIAASLERDVSAQDTAISNLDKLWKGEGSPSETAENWALQESKKDLSTISSNRANAGNLTDLIDAAERERLDWEKKSEARKNAEDALSKAKLALKEAEAGAPSKSDLVKLLREAKTFIDGDGALESCPVCERPINREQLTTTLGQRISAMDSLEVLIKASDQAQRKFDLAKEADRDAASSYVKSLREVCVALASSNLGQVKDAKLPNAETILVAKNDSSIQDCLNVEQKIHEALSVLRASLVLAKTDWDKTITQHNGIITYYENVKTTRSKAAETATLNERAKKALTVVENHRKQFVQYELSSIANDVDRLYAKLHPDEKLGSIKLALDPRYQQSLNLTASFHSVTDVTPQSLYSESHLDTLGFAVFLALAKKYQTQDSIIVFDDIVTSVDANHLERFIELLHDESSHFSHIILTSHYRPWRDRYKQQRASGNEIHFVELGPWSLETGIRIYYAPSMIQELKSALNDPNFNRREISNTAGMLLENTLDWLTVKYGCRLPRKSEPNYCLRELLDGASSKSLVKVLRVERLASGDVAAGTAQWASTDLKPHLDKIKQLSAVRNQVGCHYNFDGSLVTDKDVEDFGRAALNFAELLCCPSGGDLPNKDKSGQYWESRSGVVRLYPLQIPENG